MLHKGQEVNRPLSLERKLAMTFKKSLLWSDEETHISKERNRDGACSWMPGELCRVGERTVYLIQVTKKSSVNVPSQSRKLSFLGKLLGLFSE